MPVPLIPRVVRPVIASAVLGSTIYVIAGAYPTAAVAQTDGSLPQAVGVTAPAKQFFTAVRANFGGWDLNHDGRLTREEIELEMQDRRITGVAAAALGALKLSATRSNYLLETRSYSLADIDAMEDRLQQGQPEKSDQKLVRDFAYGIKKLKEVPRQLFSEGVPHLAAIRQDRTSDCYFLSASGALAEARPEAIARMIAPNRDDTYVVSFPGRASVRVSAPTDAEIAAYSDARDGIWLNLLERAYAIVRIKAEPSKPATREPLDSVGFRTGSSSVIELLTGHPSKVIQFPIDSHRAADMRLLQQVRGELISAIRQHRVMETQKASHDFAVTGYDAASDQVTIHNPYDRGGYETMPDGNKAERTSDGFFTLSTAQFVNYFKYLRYESGGGRS